MRRLRVGTRGSDLALWQTRWVSAALRHGHPEIEIEEVVIKSQGDELADRPFGSDWPVGAFVHALELALLKKQVDFVVHSFKDVQTVPTPGLTIAAVPAREAAHDVLLTKMPLSLHQLPVGFRVGTGSPRRSAQMRRLSNVQIVPIRGNVPTRIKKLDNQEYDGIVLAAAGLRRLGIHLPYSMDLPIDRFVPAPAQGALAVQCRSDDVQREELQSLDDAPTRAAVTAERSFLRGVEAGCQTPAGAFASVSTNDITLHAQLFSDDGLWLAEGTLVEREPEVLGLKMAEQLKRELLEHPCASG
jgi:hydroxymethylbilane synthase